jgi:hypothetical protein
MRQRLRRCLVMLAAVIVAAPLWAAGPLAAPASAATRSFADLTGDSGTAPDVVGATVRNPPRGSQNRLVVSIRHAGIPHTFVSFFIWFDTNTAHAGPEYRFRVIPNSEGVFLLRWRGGWSGRSAGKVNCPRLGAAADMFSDAPVRVMGPRSCLGGAGRIKVAVLTRDDQPPAVSIRHTDWAPAARTFLRVVGR